MKFIHLSDLHLGKRVKEYSMLEDQKFILISILKIIDEVKPEAVVIAGDIYDKSVPATEAVELFDDFLVKLAGRKLNVFVISGNHDSPERLAFGNRLIYKTGIHISPVYNGDVTPIKLEDEYGVVNFYMLPYIKPANVRRFFVEKEISTYTDAVRVAVEHMAVDKKQRNVLITHQFVTGAKRSGSEETSIGGSDNIDASVLEGFDYVALGHIHGPQNVESKRIRYCGSPLKYSLSEIKYQKSLTVIELNKKDTINVKTINLTPLHDMTEIKGKYSELMNKEYYDGKSLTSDYVRIILTDEDDIPDAQTKLRIVYKNFVDIDYDNQRTRHQSVIIGVENAEIKTPLQLFDEFYELQNGQKMSEEQSSYISNFIEKIWEEAQ
jgi:exonuclease SbcD